MEDDQAHVVSIFARVYFSTVADREFLQEDWDNLYGSVLSCWHYFKDFDGHGFKVRVFNPDLEEDGWHSDHTIVEAVYEDKPFIVDSIRMEIINRGISVHGILGSVIRLKRAGEKIDISRKYDQREAVTHFEVDRQDNLSEMAHLEAEIGRVLELVSMAVADFEAMQAKLVASETSLRENVPPGLDVQEICDLLAWLPVNNFTFLGYEEYRVVDDKGGLELDQSCGLSRIHRPTYMDCITVKLFDSEGKESGLARFLGLFTAEVFSQRPSEIPWVRVKVAEIFVRSALDQETHLGRELLRHIETFPREELFFTSVDQLFDVLVNILSIQERRLVRVFVCPNEGGFFVSCIVYVPRDLYNTKIRTETEALLLETFNATDISFDTTFSESILARTRYVLRVNSANELHFDQQELEQQVRELTQSWEEGMSKVLLSSHGEAEGSRLSKQFRGAFSDAYKSDYTPHTAVKDIENIRELQANGSLAMALYRAVEDEQITVRFKMFLSDAPMVLSDVIPILENMGARVMGENPYQIQVSDQEQFFIHDFELEFVSVSLIEVHTVRDIFQEAFEHVWKGMAENDGFNRLVLGAKLNCRQVSVLRAYARYMRQIRFGFSQIYIADVLSRFSDISFNLYRLFESRFDPSSDRTEADKHVAQLHESILASLDQVENLADDRIIRRFLELIEATTRTNYFQQDENGNHKTWISFKFDPDRISDLPLPRPKYEIFVYSPRVEGVHLRGGRVARGGLRWSDRTEDYRTEILGLAKAQQVKNSVIVPVGAKGGFIPKLLPDGGSRQEMTKEAIICYRIFIQGLLDLTDNLSGAEVVPPEQVVRYDPDDPYLVVAADKGTASFSDIANEIARTYGFWLGDAFASGGSAGYDHKKMGITARGAWRSVQQHFRDLKIDVQKTDITVVGIGDMSGDVFGNGMLMSEHIKLVGAFNHLRIFIDPDPDPRVSFSERKRLYESVDSTWADYDSKLISKGGGVYLRTAKSIAITPEMKARFDIDKDSLTPNELIVALLKAPVDLLWNGGIGTYVKAQSESDADVGDRSNDAVRVNGSELRCKVIGEGGNLGATQLGRVEFSLANGACFTDFIDNAGGVNCSDMEVNIKILLNELVANGDMTGKQRDALLENMTEEIAAQVLKNNYNQARIINLVASESTKRMDEYMRLIAYMESDGRIDRSLEFLPDEEALAERKVKGLTIAAPEICVLTSYTKNILKEELVTSDVPDDEYMAREMYSAFPETLVKEYASMINRHRLRRELVSSQIANSMVNRMGMSYVYRMKTSTGVDEATIAKAYVTARDVFRMDELWSQIEGLDLKIEPQLQKELLAAVVRLVRRSSRWFLRNRRKGLDPAVEVPRFADGVKRISDIFSELLVGEGLIDWQTRFEGYLQAGVPNQLARMVAAAPYLYLLLGLIEAARQSDQRLEWVARIYFKLGDRLDLHWYSTQLYSLEVTNQWQALAREAFHDDLDWQRRSLTTGVLTVCRKNDSVDKSIDRWMKSHELLVERWSKMLVDMRASSGVGYPLFSVANRELLDLAQAGKFGD
jgi:glutamate dehydrogenase